MKAGKADHWDTYWSDGNQAAYAAAGPLQALLDQHWNKVASRAAPRGGMRVLDIAAGSGAGSRSLLKFCEAQDLPEVIALDVSWEAVRQARQRHQPAIQAAADRLPVAGGVIDLVISQFGLEYAGPSAVEEVARVTRRGGRIELLMHHRAGALQRENECNLGAVAGFIDSAVLPAFAALVAAAPEARAAKETVFAQAVQACGAALHQWGRDAAGGALLQLYRDLAAMHARLDHQDPAEVARWADQTGRGLVAYAERMRHMLHAALDAQGVGHYCELLGQAGFEVTLDELAAGDRYPAAWTLAAVKPA